MTLLLGCASHPPTADLTETIEAPAFTSTGTAPLQDRWWQAFEDPALNEQVAAALDKNFSLQSAWYRLREARASVRVASAGLSPQLDGTASARGEEGWGESERTELSVGLEASYEVDLWGRIEAQVDAERRFAQASRFDYRATALLLTGELTEAWYQLIAIRAQLDLIDQQIETNEQVLDLLRQRFAIGEIRSADVLRQQQLIEATREQAILARQREALLVHQIALLTGQPAQQYRVATGAAFSELPAMPATGLPAELIERRPDVRRQFELLASADRSLAAAVSDQYPRLTLLASLQSTAENPGDLFSNWLAAVAGQAVAPLIDGGRRRAEVDRTAAIRDQRLAEYARSVLTSYREVQDALTLEATRDQRLRNIERRLELLQTTFEQLRTQYINGVTDYLAVLDVLTDQQALQRDAIDARLDRITARIALHRSLAGGFETPREQPDIELAKESTNDE